MQGEIRECMLELRLRREVEFPLFYANVWRRVNDGILAVVLLSSSLQLAALRKLDLKLANRVVSRIERRPDTDSFVFYDIEVRWSRGDYCY